MNPLSLSNVNGKNKITLTFLTSNPVISDTTESSVTVPTNTSNNEWNWLSLDRHVRQSFSALTSDLQCPEVMMHEI